MRVVSSPEVLAMPTAVAKLVAPIVLGCVLAAACGGPQDRERPYYKRPLLPTSRSHRFEAVSKNHPDIYTASVERGLDLLKTKALGVKASAFTTYETDKVWYEFDLETGRVAKRMDVPYPVPVPLEIVDPPDRGGDRGRYVAILTDMGFVVERVSRGDWGPFSRFAPAAELRHAGRYIRWVVAEVSSR